MNLIYLPTILTVLTLALIPKFHTTGALLKTAVLLTTALLFLYLNITPAAVLILLPMMLIEVALLITHLIYHPLKRAIKTAGLKHRLTKETKV